MAFQTLRRVPVQQAYFTLGADGKLPPRTRLLVITGLSLLLWTLLAGVAGASLGA